MVLKSFVEAHETVEGDSAAAHVTATVSLLEELRRARVTQGSAYYDFA